MNPNMVMRKDFMCDLPYRIMCPIMKYIHSIYVPDAMDELVDAGGTVEACCELPDDLPSVLKKTFVWTLACSLHGRRRHVEQEAEACRGR